MNQNTLKKEVNLDFEKKERQLQLSNLREVLFSKELYEKVNVNVTIQNISPIQAKTTSNGVLKLRSATAVDKKEEMQITFC